MLLRDILGLGLLTVEDCLQPLRMPKMDSLSQGHEGGVAGGMAGAFVAAFAVRLERFEGEPRLRALEVDLVVGSNYLVTVRDGPLDEVEGRLRTFLNSGCGAWDALPPSCGSTSRTSPTTSARP